jgi:hypothetical protein
MVQPSARDATMRSMIFSFVGLNSGRLSMSSTPQKGHAALQNVVRLMRATRDGKGKALITLNRACSWLG